MEEVYKHQIEDLSAIVDLIKGRNYKFIIFMDDLSFEHSRSSTSTSRLSSRAGLKRDRTTSSYMRPRTGAT
jgi:hypothetical protein